MSEHPAFELLKSENLVEVGSKVSLYRHKATGGEVLSFENDDENKVFGVTFKTPPEDSTGIAHILEHSVLCGSRKYPVKKPFVEMLKGSLHTFLNAMTFPDKTAYPVASQNLQDFYNLVDVYLDAVFFPLLTEDTLKQEGWHYERESAQGPMQFKGVVFNEMKGAYSSPAALLGRLTQQSLFPDTTYGVDSGGDPTKIPDLSYAQFERFHETYYHPSNARVVFYGDDEPAKRLELIEEYFKEFRRADPTPPIALQKRWSGAKQFVHTYVASEDEAKRPSAMVSINWLLDEVTDSETVLTLNILESVLVGTPAAPLRKALIDSGLGEGLTGSGFADGIRQPYFTFGLKGIVPEDADKVEAVIVSTLNHLVRDGIDPATIEAAMNTAEFNLRENNTGSFPRGLSLMFRALGTWLYDGDPIAPLAFEAPLAAMKARLRAGERVFESLIETHILNNPHQTSVLLKPDPTQAAREAAAERARLDAAADALGEAGLKQVAEDTKRLIGLQQKPDDPAALQRIPMLTLKDLPRTNKPIPAVIETLSGRPFHVHEMATNGVVYLDLAFDLKTLPGALWPYLPLFTRALTQTGVGHEDFVTLTQRIGRLTGGVGASRWSTTRADGQGTAAYLFLRGKAVPERLRDLLDIMKDVLTDAQLGNRERLKQMALEAKAGFESSLAGAGHSIAAARLRAGFTEGGWLNEITGGVSQYEFIKALIARIDSDWPSIEAALKDIRRRVLGRAGLVASVTADSFALGKVRPILADFIADLPEGERKVADWGFKLNPKSEGLSFPGQVNYVTKGANLKALGYSPTGASAVVLQHLNTTYLWDRVRVEGGAYGAGAGLDLHSGLIAFTSYRDPNVTNTLKAYDAAADFLKQGVNAQQLTSSIIGVIGSVDTYRLPDAKGFAALTWSLMGDTDAARQARRESVLGATSADFVQLGEALAALSRQGEVVVLGSEAAIKGAAEDGGPTLPITRVL
jgi:Zn-dependent M16 (insulinase) family peptidase